MNKTTLPTPADTTEAPLERHPWAPFMPEGARVLIMGTFPPGAHRWGMNFYYPNPTNDFWRIMGMIFCGDKDALLIPGTKEFDLKHIRALMTERHVALNDTARAVRRLRGNASDKYLEIVERVPLAELLAEMPECRAVATTGEKAAGVVAELTATPLPRMGERTEARQVMTATGVMAELKRPVDVWRMPSTSRAYPMAVAKKAEYYERMFRHAGIIQ